MQHALKKYSDVTKTVVGHNPREIFRLDIYISSLRKERLDYWKNIPVKYWPSPIPSGGLETPFIQKFNCSKSITFLKIKQIVDKLYEYEFIG